MIGAAACDSLILRHPVYLHISRHDSSYCLTPLTVTISLAFTKIDIVLAPDVARFETVRVLYVFTVIAPATGVWFSTTF
jgi:hypothetical protein